jgi:hypothetical protein
VAIKTYPFESGLYYLAKSLQAILEERGISVFLIKKESFVRENNKWLVKLSETQVSDKFINIDISSLKKLGINLIISLETSTLLLDWIKECTLNNIKIIDVIMPEWVLENHLRNNTYSLFNSIWCLNDYILIQLSKLGYSNAVKESWDFCPMQKDKNLTKSNSKIIFYHQASLSENFSYKNTDLVVSAFANFYEKHNDCELLISGIYSKECPKNCFVLVFPSTCINLCFGYIDIRVKQAFNSAVTSALK